MISGWRNLCVASLILTQAGCPSTPRGGTEPSERAPGHRPLRRRPPHRLPFRPRNQRGTPPRLPPCWNVSGSGTARRSSTAKDG